MHIYIIFAISHVPTDPINQHRYPGERSVVPSRATILVQSQSHQIARSARSLRHQNIARLPANRFVPYLLRTKLRSVQLPRVNPLAVWVVFGLDHLNGNSIVICWFGLVIFWTCYMLDGDLTHIKHSGDHRSVSFVHPKAGWIQLRTPNNRNFELE